MDNESSRSISEQLESFDNIDYALRRTVTMKRLYGQYCYDVNLQVYFPGNESPSNTSIDRIHSLSEDELRERDEMTDQIANINNNFKPNPIHSDTELDAKRFTRQDCIQKLSKLNINLNESREDEIESIVSEYSCDNEQQNRSSSGSEDSLRNYGYYNSEQKYLQTINPYTRGNSINYYQGSAKYKYCRMSPPKDGPDRNVFMIKENSRRSSAAETISEYLNKHDRKSKKAGRFSNDSDTSSSDKYNGYSNNNFDRKESTCNKRKSKSSQRNPSQISANTLDDVDQMPTSDTTKYPSPPIHLTDNFIFNSKGHVNYNIINDLYNDNLSDKSNTEKEMKKNGKALKRVRENKIQKYATRKKHQEIDYENQKRIKKPSKNNMLFSRNNNQYTDSDDSEYRERKKNQEENYYQSVNQEPSKSNLLFNRVKTPYYQKEKLKIETTNKHQDNNVYTTQSGNNLLFTYRERAVQQKDEKNVAKIEKKLPSNDIKEENKNPSTEMIKSYIKNKRKNKGQGDIKINKNQALDVKNLFTKLINIKQDSKKEKVDSKHKKKSKKVREVYDEEINKIDLKRKILDQFKKVKFSDFQNEPEVVNKSQKDKNKIRTNEWSNKCESSHLGYKFPKKIKERHESNSLDPVDIKDSNCGSLNIASNSSSYSISTYSDESENSYSTNTKFEEDILDSSSISLSEWERNYRENKVALKKIKQGKTNSSSKKTSSTLPLNDWRDKRKTNGVATKKQKHNKSNSPNKIIAKISSSFSSLSLNGQVSSKTAKGNSDTKKSSSSLSFNEWWDKRKKKSEVAKQKLIHSRHKKPAKKSSSYGSIYSVEWRDKFEENRQTALKKIKKVKVNRGTKKTSSSLSLNDWTDICEKNCDVAKKNVKQNKNNSGNKKTVKKSSSYSSILSIVERKEKCHEKKVKKVKRYSSTKKTSSRWAFNEWEKLEKPDKNPEATKKDCKENKNKSPKKKVQKVNRNSGSNKTSSSLSFNEWLEKRNENSEAAKKNVKQNKKKSGGKKNVKKSSSDSSISVVKWPEKRQVAPEKVKTVKHISGTKKTAEKLSAYNSKAINIWPQERKKNCDGSPKKIKVHQSNSGNEKIPETAWEEKRKENCRITLKDDKKIDDNTYSSNRFVCLNEWEDINVENEVTQEELTDNKSNFGNTKIEDNIYSSNGFISVNEWEDKNKENEVIQKEFTLSNCGNKKISQVSVLSFNTWVNNYDENFDITEINSNSENKKIKKYTSSSSSLFSLNEWLDKCEEKCEVALMEARKNKSNSHSKKTDDEASTISNTSIDMEEEICRKNLEQLQKEFEDLERRLANQECLKQTESSSSISLKSCVKVTQESCKVIQNAESKKSVSSKNTEYENDVFEDDKEDIKISKYSGTYLLPLKEKLQKLEEFLLRGQNEMEKTSSNSINDDCELTINLELNDEPGQNQIKVQVKQPWEGERIALVRTTSAPVINSSEFTIYSQTIQDSGIGTSFNDLKQVYFVRKFDSLRKTVSLSPQIVNLNPFRDNTKQTFQKELQFTEDFDLKFIVPPKQLSSSSEDSFQAALRNKNKSRKKQPKMILNKNNKMKLVNFPPSGTSDSTSENSFEDDSSRTNYGLHRIKNIRRMVRKFIRRQLYHISKVL